MIRLFSLFIIISLLGGCAFAPQKATLAPVVDVASSSEGEGITVAVRVVDERPSKSLGRRGTAYGAAAEITTDQDLAVIVQQQLTDGLKKKGFEVMDYSDNKDPRLSIEIRLLEYTTSQGFWTGGVQIQGAIKAVAAHNGDSFERLYRSEKNERIVIVPTAATNESWINTALSDLMNQLFEDVDLFRFLSG